MKEKLKYEWYNREIIYRFEEINADEFLSKTVQLMQSIWYSNESIVKALDNITVE